MWLTAYLLSKLKKLLLVCGSKDYFCVLKPTRMANQLQNHEIDYHIYGEELQFVEIELDPQETAIAESGAMMMMEDGIEMQTIFGDGSTQQNSGFLGKLLSHV